MNLSQAELEVAAATASSSTADAATTIAAVAATMPSTAYLMHITVIDEPTSSTAVFLATCPS